MMFRQQTQFSSLTPRFIVTCGVLLMLVAVAGLGVRAQSTANYVFTSSNTGTLEDLSTGATNLLSTGVNHDDDASLVTPIGFTFYFQGQAFTQFSANSNGQIRLGATAVSGVVQTFPTASVPLIVPLSNDNSIEPTGFLRSKLINTTPGSRVLAIEWIGFRIPFSAAGGGTVTTSQFQVLLYETTSVIQFKYGRVFNNLTTATGRSIGFSSSNVINTVKSVTVGAVPTDSNAAVPVSNSFPSGADVPNLSSTTEGSRVVYTFTPQSGQPAAPSTPTFTGVTGTTITVDFNDNSNNETFFRVLRSTDGTNFTQVGVIASTTTAGTGTAYSFADTGLSPSTTYTYRIQAFNEGGLPSANADAAQTTNAPAIIACVPAGGNYSLGATWQGGIAPTTNEIANVTGCTVTLDTTTATASSVVVGNGGTLQYGLTAATLTVSNSVTVQSGGTFTAGLGTVLTHALRIGGSTAGAAGTSNLLIDGTFDMNTTAGVTTTFFGANNAAISGAGATADFFAIVVNKGTAPNSLNGVIQDVNRVITINSPTASANRLVITAGTFRINSASPLTPYFGTQTIAASAGRLWIANSGAIVSSVGAGTTTGAGSPTITGYLQISDGEFRYGSGNNTLATGSSGTGGVIIGSLNTFDGEIRDGDDRRKGYDDRGNEIQLAPTARLTMFGSANFTSNFTMTEGNIVIDPQRTDSGGNNASATAVDTFSLSVSTCGTACSVNFTGGTVTIVDPANVTTRAVALNAPTAFPQAQFNLQGSTIQLGDGVSTSTGNGTNGFTVDTYAGNTVVYLGNVIVNGGSATGRFARSTVSTANATAVNGTLTINPTSEYRVLQAQSAPKYDFCLNGSLVNNGTLTSTGRFVFGCSSTTAEITVGTPGTSAPSITAGAGAVFRNLAVGATGNFSRLFVNTNGTVNFPALNFTVVDTLDFFNGILSIPSGNKLTGITTLFTSARSATATNGYVLGTLERTFPATTAVPFVFHVGENGYSPVTATVSAGTFPSSLSARAVDATAPGLVRPDIAISRYWNLLETGDLTATLTFDYLATGDAPATMTDPTRFLIFKDTNGAAPFVFPDGTADNVDETNTIGTLLAPTTEFSNWSIGDPVAPTVAAAPLGGRVTTNNNRPLAGVNVRLTNTANGQIENSVTDGNGEYDFAGVLVGQSYVVSAARRGYGFAPSSQLVNHQSAVDNVNFTANVTDLRAAHVRNDFDGDGRTDNVVFRPSEKTWYIQESLSGAMRSVQFGLADDKLVPADYDGDGKTDVAVFRPSNGNWYILQSTTGEMRAENWGIASDVTVAADYDGDGRADLAVWRESEGIWYIKQSSNGQSVGVQFGQAGDRPLIGDFDGDNRADVTVLRAASAEANASVTIYTLRSTDSQMTTAQWGYRSDAFLTEDFDGDGRDDVAAFRANGGNWFVKRSSNNTMLSTQWGIATDTALTGDYDGDGLADFGTYRTGTSGVFHVYKQASGASATQWGSNGDVVISSKTNF